VDLKGLFALESLRQLQVLQVYHCHNYPLETLAGNPALSTLRQLLLYPHASEPGDGAYITLEGVRAVLHSLHLRQLTHLQLRLSDMGDEGCVEIVRSGVLKRLKVLDMMYGCVTDRGAETLASCPDLANLELLDVSYNRLTDTGIEALRRSVVNCRASDQYGPSSYEDEYLMQGDWE
jgi:hypothetical protein